MTAHRSLPRFTGTPMAQRPKPHWRQRPLSIAVTAVCAALFALSASGAEDIDDNLASMSLENLLNMEVVSATRSESKLSESPVPISVITDKEIANSGLDNIPDILARLGEADVLHIGASQTEVSIRGKGINFNRRMLVLIDGRTEYNDLLGVTFWNAFPISVDDILRIEVVRGPASALFGANAYSGVINIITKPAEGDSGAALRYHGGEMGREYGNLQGHFGSEHFSAKLSIASQSLNSDETQVEFPGYNRFPTTTNFNADDESLEQVVRANGQLVARVNEDIDFRLGVGMSDGSYELIPQPGLPRDKWDIDTDYLHFIANFHFSDAFSMQFNAYQNNFAYETRLVPDTSELLALAPDDGRRYFPSVNVPADTVRPAFAGDVETNDYTVQFVGKAFDGQFNWVLGGEYREIENKGGLVQDSTKSIQSFFHNYTIKFGDSGWLAGVGLRIDDDSLTGKDYGYSASLTKFFNERDNLRFTARRAFRAPSLFEQYSQVELNVPFKNQNVCFLGNLVRAQRTCLDPDAGANPDFVAPPPLGVETIESLDLTYTVFVGDRLQLTFEAFQEHYKEIIGNPDSGVLDDVELDPATNTFYTTTTFQNLADAESTGVQAGLFWLAADTLTLYANYRYTNPKDLNSVPGETFFSPEHKAGFGALWQMGDFVVDISDQYTGETDASEFVGGNVSPDGPNFTRDNQESYNLLNLAFHWRPGTIKGLGAYIAVNNALDDRHVEYYEYDEVLKAAGESYGRAVWGGLSWKF